MSNERSLAGIVLFLALAILGLGFVAYSKLDAYVREQTQDNLSRIAQVKSTMFSAWWSERQGDVTIIAADRLFAQQIQHFLADRNDFISSEALRNRMALYLRAYPYKSASLYAPDGKLVLNVNSAGSSLSNTSRRIAQKAIAEKHIIFSELHVEEFTDGIQTIDIDIAIPMHITSDSAMVGVLAITINTELFLNFAVRNSPLLTEGMELILAQKNGDKVTIINPRARALGENLVYQRPLNTPDLPAARAARGERGIIEGIDYRGNRVTAFLLGIPNSDWVMLVKLDHSRMVDFQQNILLGVGGGVLILSLIAFLVLRYKLSQSEATYLLAEVAARRQQDALAQQTLEATKRLQAILENTPFGLAIISLDRIIEQANAAFCAVFDVPQENLIGKSASVLYGNEDDYVSLGKRAYPLLHRGEIFDDIVPMQRRNGDQIFVRLAARVIDTQSEHPIAVWAAEDVTEKRRLEQAIRERERFYEDVFQSSAAVNLLIDPVSRLILDGNETACHYYAYPLTQLRGMPLATIFHGTQDELDNWLTTVNQQRHSKTQARHLLSNGAVRDVDIFANHISIHEQPHLMLIVHDITERLQSQAHLIQARDALRMQKRELERSNADLEQFAYVASHDLRQPLRQVSSFLSLLERRYSPALNEEARGYIDYARNGALKMDRLIVDLLEFSRIGRHNETFEPLPLQEIIQDALSYFVILIEEIGATIEIPKELPVTMGHRGEMVRLWQNLIGNALKYRHSERPCHIILSCEQTQERIILHLQDNGIGIPDEFQERIFGIFQRLHGAEHYEGTGIGLAVCRRIVEHHHGTLAVESDGKSGSTFIVTLPCQ